VLTGLTNNQLGGNSRAGIAIDASNNIYFTDATSIYKLTPGGVKSTFAGGVSPGYQNGPAVSAQFNWPGAMVFDTSGNMFVLDVLNNVIREITPAGVVSTFVGTPSGGYKDGTGAAASFSQPYEIQIDSANNLYVPDNNNSVIRKVTPAGVVTSVAYAPYFQSQTGQVPPSGALILPVAGSNIVYSLTKNGVLNTPVKCAEEKITLP
jgi:hypothetical protein